MRRNRWLLSATALLATLVGASPALAQAHPAAAPAHAAAAPSAAPVTCAEGEVLLHGHCCAVGADWAPAQHRCFAHNRRQAIVLVVVTAAQGSLPPDVTATMDGTAMAGTPPSATTTPGAHAVQVTATGFTTSQQSVTVAAGDVQRVEVALTPSVGGVRVNVTTDGAQVLLDGQPITGSPPSRADVPPGPHHIEVSAPGHETVRGDVTVASGETATLDVGELTVTPPPAPPSASPPPEPPPVTQVITVTVVHPGQTFDVAVDTHGGHYHCATSVSQPTCTIRDVPAGSAHITTTGDATFEDDVRIPVGPSTLTVDYSPASTLARGLYIALGVACFIPTIAMTAAAATCTSDSDTCTALTIGAVGLLVVPGIAPGVFYLATGALGTGTVVLHVVADNGSSSSSATVSTRRGWRDRRRSAVEFLPPTNPGTLLAF